MVKSSKQIFSTSPYIRRKTRLSAEHLANIDQYLHELLSQDSDRLRKTHFFHDRYENIYIDNHELCDLQRLVEESRQYCAELIGVEVEELSLGYWFNLMGPGHITDWHTHDDMDELVSGVVYLTVPQNSGSLMLKVDAKDLVVEPVVGHFIFFDPETPHMVGENKSNHHRLSIGMNIGLTVNKQ